jgi:hypothetical protein
VNYVFNIYFSNFICLWFWVHLQIIFTYIYIIRFRCTVSVFILHKAMQLPLKINISRSNKKKILTEYSGKISYEIYVIKMATNIKLICWQFLFSPKLTTNQHWTTHQCIANSSRALKFTTIWSRPRGSMLFKCFSW